MKKVLIIDDEELLREIWQLEFEDQGYTVVVANSGIEGIDFVKSTSFDLIITDLKMRPLKLKR